MSSLDWNTEKHPDWYKDVPKMKTLILGSFPPHKLRWDYRFYYPNANNWFWEIMAKLAGKKLEYTKKLTEKEKLKAVEERYQIMCCLNIGVQNIGLKIKRKGERAGDTDIKIEEYQDIISIIKKHKELGTILLLGYSAPNSAARTFLKYLDKENISYKKVEELKQGKTFSINVFNRKLECVVLNSTSKSAARAGITEDKLLKQFKKHL